MLQPVALHNTQAERSHPDGSTLYKVCQSFVGPELHKGHDEVERAAHRILPAVVSVKDIRGEPNACGSHSSEQIAVSPRKHGITDHSHSLKRTLGISVEDPLKPVPFDVDDGDLSMSLPQLTRDDAPHSPRPRRSPCSLVKTPLSNKLGELTRRQRVALSIPVRVIRKVQIPA